MYMVVIKVFWVVFCARALFASFYTEVFFFFYIVKVVRMISVDQKRSPAKEQPFQLIELSTWFQTDTTPTSFPHYYFVFLRNKLLYFFLYFFVFPANRKINLIPNWYTTNLISTYWQENSISRIDIHIKYRTQITNLVHQNSYHC